MSAGQHHDSERPKPRSTLTGVRNDSSSLFSLDLVRRAEAVAALLPSEPDDEAGTIDLQALIALSKSAPSRVDRAPLIVSASAGLFATSPVSVPPCVLAEIKPAAPVTDPPPNFSPKRANLVVAMGAVVAVAVAAAAFLGMQAGAAPQPLAAAAVAAMVPAPPGPLPPSSPVLATPPPAPQIAVVTPGQRASTPSTPESPKPAAAVARAAVPRKSAGSAASRAAAKEAAPSAETRPAAPVCDLTCQMQRAVAATK